MSVLTPDQFRVDRLTISVLLMRVLVPFLSLIVCYFVG